MTIPSNLFQTVQTYQSGELAFLQNYCCMLSTFDKRFKDFQNFEGNLGSTVTFDLPPQAFAQYTLNVDLQASVQRIGNLTVDQPISVGRAITAQQLMFNDMKDYMMKFGKADIMTIGTKAETVLALNAHSAVPVRDQNGNPTGALHTESGPYRFYGDGTTSIGSYGQLAQMIENFRSTGSANEIKVYLPNVKVPSIVNSGLSQFVLKRNEKTAQSWELGSFDNITWYKSNVMPIHYSGNTGVDGDTLTVVSTNDPSGANITQITFSGATRLSGNDPNAVKSGDVFQFNIGVSGHPDTYFLTNYGQVVTTEQVQFRATADAVSSSGNVTINIFPALCAVGIQSQNISNNIVAGMQVHTYPSHLCGLLVNANGALLAMPRMPDAHPYPSANKVDEFTGATLRSYYGMMPFQNQYGYVHDLVIGSTLVPDWCMRILFPING